MANALKELTIVVADAVPQTRNLVSEVLRSVGFDSIIHARDGQELLDMTIEHEPRIVITTSRLPGLSGLEFTRMVRAGYENIPRQLSIIVMTNTPTKVFLDKAQDSGVDEMLARPFTAQAVLVRVQAVLERPREFIDSANYIGPCRRRRMVHDYIGPMRRFVDPTDDMPGASPWESENNRQAVRTCVKKISEMAEGLTAGDRRKLREIYSAVKETEAIADESRDAMLGAAARSLGRYIMAIGATGTPDAEVMSTHIDAMHSLGLLTSAQHKERQNLVDGLVRIVDKKLGRIRAA
ncbi:MAG: response regulator [Alphaproteobacteria bacterium]|nr:response regulator [Alphaproteobacteria bacterium]